MGFLHHSAAPLTTNQIAAALPGASDPAVRDTAYLALAYERLRGAFLAMSGVSLLRSLGIAEPADLAGVITTARLALEQAHEHVLHAANSSSTPVRIRGTRASAAIEALAQEAARAARDGFSDIDVRVLRIVRRTLASTSLPAAGILHLSSVSCAGYDAADVNPKDHHGPTGDGGYVDGNLHDHRQERRRSTHTTLRVAPSHTHTHPHQH